MRGVSRSPKRSESSTAIGRAPSAKMSRRMPPTPVAAPWKGSTAEGWLWLSTLNTTARPSPTSIAPAFSPGPISTRSPSVGSLRSSFLECLYAQCSDHSSENTASSTALGSRPSRSTMRRVSSSVRPRARASDEEARVSSAAAVLTPLTGESAVNSRSPSVDPVSASVACSGCGIRPSTLPFSLRDAGDVAGRAVRVVAGRVAQHELAVCLELVELLGRGEPAAGRVLDRQREDLTGLRPAGEHGAIVLDDDVDLPAHEPQRVVGQQRARQQVRLAQHLEAVADPEHRPALAREARDLIHDRRKAGDRTNPQVVAIGKPARDDHRVDALQVAVRVPEVLRLEPRALHGEEGVVLVARAREEHDADPGAHPSDCTS